MSKSKIVFEDEQMRLLQEEQLTLDYPIGVLAAQNVTARQAAFTPELPADKLFSNHFIQLVPQGLS